MHRCTRLVFLAIFSFCSLVNSETFSVRIITENHVNEVDTKFVSFTVDPKHLFASNEKSKGKDSTCMAASLTPAYIRIAGPSTSHIMFHNTSMSLHDLEVDLPEPNKQKRHTHRRKPRAVDSEEPEDILSKLKASHDRLKKKQKTDSFEAETQSGSHESILSKLKSKRNALKLKKTNEDSEVQRNRLRRSGEKDSLGVNHRQWKRFIQWARSTGFELVFAVNNGEKTENGMWDPNPALNMLTYAEKDNVTDIFWQLGYECSNQTIEDYLNDLETLRVMVDTFNRQWKVVGGDITNCLQEDSKSDFKDYVTLSSESMDAVLLNGNSSSRELERMPSSTRLALLRSLSTSPTPLWLTESPQQLSETARAADWLTSLGYSARNGFDVHFRELAENELYEPTLSFYMALLFKNLVGQRVLDITMDPSEASALFAHCTSLRRKAVPGAVTLFGVNLDEEAARFSVKLGRREEGGDIMQFILGHDHNGNIVVNGRPMYYEGDIRPVVKRVRPYKTLLLNLPPNTFGFWVLANTKVDACFDYEQKNNVTLVEAKPVNDTSAEKVTTDLKEDKDSDVSKEKRVKRSVNVDDFEMSNVIDNDEALRSRIESINRGLRDLHGVFGKEASHRVKRQFNDDDYESRKKPRRQGLKKLQREHKLLGSGIFEKLMSNINLSKVNLTKNLKELKLRNRSNKNKLFKRNSRNYRNKEESQEANKDGYLSRRKRSVLSKHDMKRSDGKTLENEIDLDDKKPLKFGKILHKQEKLKKYIENRDNIGNSNEEDADEIEFNTKLTNDDAVFKITENADRGLLKNTFENALALLEELNNNLSKLWRALSILD